MAADGWAVVSAVSRLVVPVTVTVSALRPVTDETEVPGAEPSRLTPEVPNRER